MVLFYDFYERFIFKMQLNADLLIRFTFIL